MLPLRYTSVQRSTNDVFDQSKMMPLRLHGQQVSNILWSHLKTLR